MRFRAIAIAYDFVRGAMGADEYARHVEHLRRSHPDARVPTRREFFERRERERWIGVNRCC